MSAVLGKASPNSLSLTPKMLSDKGTRRTLFINPLKQVRIEFCNFLNKKYSTSIVWLLRICLTARMLEQSHAASKLLRGGQHIPSRGPGLCSFRQATVRSGTMLWLSISSVPRGHWGLRGLENKAEGLPFPYPPGRKRWLSLWLGRNWVCLLESAEST